MHIGEHRDAKFLFHAFEHDQAVFQAGAAKAGVAGAVGFVEAGFENVAEAQPVADLLDMPRL